MTRVTCHKGSPSFEGKLANLFRCNSARLFRTFCFGPARAQSLVAERKERGVAIESAQEERASLSTPVSLFIDNATLGRQLFQEMSLILKALGERTKISFHHCGSVDGSSADTVHGGARHSIQLFHPPRDHSF